MRLVYKSNGATVNVGDFVTLSEGERAKVAYFREPHSPESEGKVSVDFGGGRSREFYAGVIGAVWVDREDRGE